MIVEVAGRFENRQDAEALLGLRDNRRWAVRHRASLRQSFEYGFHRVPLDDLRVPTKRFKLGGERLEIQHVLRGPRLLEAVLIDDGRQIGELVFLGGRDRFPDLALTHLAVTHHHVGVSIETVEPTGQSVSDTERQSLAERSGGGLHRVESLHVRMALERAAEFSQGHDLLEAVVARLAQRRIQHRHRMTLAEDKAIALRVARVGLVVAEIATEVERRHHLNGGQAARRMTATSFGRDLNDEATNGLRRFFEFVQTEFSRVSHRCIP